ncbi:ATP-binding protein [Malonomonas rubra]|uniref:ATP-binding protein n=1 Tax=Malonomonas rubra TaxID=57040 RepID=UPI0026EFD7B9|nr:ATP-binding protein [Malonomonas rubra]
MQLDWNTTTAAIWRQRKEYLRPVRNVDQIGLAELLGIDRQKQQLVTNTERFLACKPANNVLLWGARGTGKSSLVKAIFNAYVVQGLRLIEVDKDDLIYLPEIVDEIRDLPQRFIVFCDDLSFSDEEKNYKHLKSVLEGSIEMAPDNVLIYATSNRRHLLPEKMRDNLDSQVVDGELHYADAVEEQISLSDRFGLWLAFYPGNMDQYLRIVDSLFADYQGERDELHEAARLFALSRATHSGRTARQFYKAFVETK